MSSTQFGFSKSCGWLCPSSEIAQLNRSGRVRASLAAAAQGAFWKYHDALFETQDKGFAQARLFKLATKLGLNLKKFKAVYNSQSTLDQIKSFKTAGMNAGVTGTPAFFVNGRKFDPDEAIMTFTKRVAMERARDRGPCQ